MLFSFLTYSYINILTAIHTEKDAITKTTGYITMVLSIIFIFSLLSHFILPKEDLYNMQQYQTVLTNKYKAQVKIRYINDKYIFSEKKDKQGNTTIIIDDLSHFVDIEKNSVKKE